MKIHRQHIEGFLIGIAVVLAVPFMAYAARTAAPVLTGLFASTTLSVNLPAPIISLGNSTTSGAVYSNGGIGIGFVVTSLDATGGESIVSNLVASSTLDQAHGWLVTWTPVPGAANYRVYFSTSTPQAFVQYFTATTTSQYSFVSTSSPVYIPAGIPFDNTAYVVRFNSNGNSWINGGGNFGVGTSSPQVPFDVASGTMRAFSRSTTTCAAVNDGAIFYNAKDAHLYVCIATVWTLIK